MVEDKGDAEIAYMAILVCSCLRGIFNERLATNSKMLAGLVHQKHISFFFFGPRNLLVSH